MEGINLRELVRKRGRGYRWLVEAVIDHETAPGDPLTPRIQKGARGVAYDFWNPQGNYKIISIAVAWETSGGEACNYLETYQRTGQIKEPNTEIKFIREITLDEQKKLLPEKNPFLIRNNSKWPPE